MRGVLPDFLSIVVSNSLAIAGTILLLIGLERFVGQRTSQFHNYFLLAAFVSVHTYFAFVQPSLLIRTLNLAVGIILICAQCAWLMLRRVGADMRPMTSGVGYVFLAFCLFSMVRIIVDLTMNPGNDFFQAGLFETLAVLINQMLFIILTFGLLLMVNRRLVADLARDIVERQRTEEALKLSEEKFFKAFHASPDAILISRVSDGKLVEVNEGFSRLSGYSPEEALTSSSINLNMWANPQDREACIAALQKDRSIRDYEYDFRVKSGEILHCLYSGEIIQLDGEAHILSVVRDITERRKIEEAIRKSENRYRSYIEVTGQLGWTTNPDGEVEEDIPSWRKFTGQSEEEVKGWGWSKALHLDDLEHATQVWKNAVSARSNYEVEYRVRRYDGVYRHFLARGVPVHKGSGEILEWVGACIDITERKQAEEALRRFELLSDNSRDIILFMRRDDGRILEANVAAMQAYEYSRDELLALTIQDLRAPDTRGLTAKQMAQADAGGILFETVHLRKDGNTFPVEVSSQGASIGGIRTLVSIVRDITERKRVEETLQQAVENLDKRTRELNAILSSVQEYVYIFDPLGRFVFANKKLLDLWGLTAEQAIGKTMRDLDYPETVETALLEAVQSVLETGQTVTNITHYTSPAGAVGSYENILAPMLGPDSKVAFVAGSSRDISERKRAEEVIASLSKFPTENPNPILRVQNDGQIIYANAASREVLEMWDCDVGGYLPAELRELIVAAAETGSGTIVDVPCNENVYSIMLVPIVEAGYVNLYGSDITARRLAEQALLESEEKYRLIADNSNDWIYWINPDRSFRYVSPSSERLTGFAPLEFMNNPRLFTDIIHHEDRSRVETHLGEVRGKDKTHNLEYRIITKTNEVRWISHSCAPVYMDDGKYIGRSGTNRDITERKRAEAALRESEQRLNRAQEIAHLGSWELNLVNNNLTWSDEVYRIFGLQPREFGATYEAFLEAVHPDDRTAVDAAYSGSLREGRDSYEIEHRIVKRSSGEVRIVHEKCEHFRDETGQIIRSVGMVHDITERKQVEAALKESEAKYRSLFSNMSEGFGLHEIILDADGNPCDYRFLELNDAFERLTGMSREQALGRTVKEVMPDLDPYWIETYGRVALTGEPVHFENYSTPLKRWYETYSYSPRKNQFAVVFVDITERKHAEEVLRESEERLRLSLHAANQGLYDLNVQTGAAIVNDEYAQMLGYDPKTFVETNSAWIERLHPDDKEVTQQAYLDYINGVLPEYRVEFRQKTQDGNWKWILSLGKIVDYDSLGKPRRMLGTHTDITERKRAEEELQRTLEELKSSNAELEEFAYVASHDLQEPLRGIAGLAQLLQRRYQGQLDSRADEYIDHIVDGTQRMQTLINDLLAYSRIGRRGEALQLTEADAALKAALKNLNAAIHEFGAAVTSESLPKVKADATQLTQLFQNLIGNALKFRGERPPQIHIGVVDAGDFWQFSVRDNGIGIEPQYFERIFQVFQRLHTRREYKGTGIGLAICKKIIDRHGGRIWVESEKAQGSMFYFTLPKGK
jgi:PAS domain S-box-containing protein